MFKKIKEFFSELAAEDFSHLPVEAYASSMGAWGFAAGLILPPPIMMSEVVPPTGESAPSDEKKEEPAEEKKGTVGETVPVRTSRLPITAAGGFKRSQ